MNIQISARNIYLVVASLVEKVQRFLFGDDIFISYSRRDGMPYAKALAARLSGYSCYLDLLGTVPDTALPLLMRKRIKRCTIFVLIGTEWAVQSNSVADEIKEFVKTGRPIIAISFGCAIERSDLYPILAGLPLEAETAAAATTGTPSASVSDRVVRSFTYTRHSARLRQLGLWTSCIVLILLAGFFAYRKILIDEGAADVDKQKKNAQCIQARANLKDHQSDGLSYHEFPDTWNQEYDALAKSVRNLCGE